MKVRKDIAILGTIMLAFLAGCGNPGGEAENSQGDSASQNMVSENTFADIVSENEAEVTVSENESHNILEEGETIALSNGLYAYVTTQVSEDIAIDGITEWIRIRNKNPEDGTFSIVPDRSVLIPNVYGPITDIRMYDFSNIIVCYENDEGEIGLTVIPMDLYASEGNVIEPVYEWEPVKVLCYNIEELTNETGYPVEVWSEIFTSGGKEYTAAYSRVSPMYKDDTWEGACFAADYQFTIRRSDEILYEVKLYQMSIKCEEVHYMEDINGDGVEDFIQINNSSVYDEEAYPYVFVWDPEQETCIYGGPVAPEEKAAYELPDGKLDGPIYTTVEYDRDTGTFYDFFKILWNDLYDYNINDRIVVCGARFIDGEWKTVYELYLGEEGADYAIETKYDEEGNIVSEITCTVEEYRNILSVFNDIYELRLYRMEDYTTEEIVVNGQFSYWKYVGNEVDPPEPNGGWQSSRQ